MMCETENFFLFSTSYFYKPLHHRMKRVEVLGRVNRSLGFLLGRCCRLWDGGCGCWGGHPHNYPSILILTWAS